MKRKESYIGAVFMAAAFVLALLVFEKAPIAVGDPGSSPVPIQAVAEGGGPGATAKSAADDSAPVSVTKTPGHLARLDYAAWQASLRPPSGPLNTVLQRLRAEPGLRSDFFIASLLHDCHLRKQGELAALEEGGNDEASLDARMSECKQLGEVAPAVWFEHMRAAADAGFAPAQTAMAVMQNPFIDMSDKRAVDDWGAIQRAYIQKAMGQCSPDAFIIHGNLSFNPDDPLAPNPSAYADFRTAELIYRSRFEGAPTVEELLQQERSRLHAYQTREAEDQALVNFHKACVK
ncbi:hypothetical protein D9M68_203920 [compost metagenome]